MENLGVGELLAIGLVLFMLFGSKKLPDVARSIGRSLRAFKAEAAKPDAEEPEPVEAPSPEEQARLLEERAARLRAEAARARRDDTG
ncbi:twin-arginine translocase TatA/TatE family subunit [Nonomuraea roseoviolacea]|uniref:Sec-independent protein translocase protein TatA n=1 Tax=Nonomuraea roseoviolacea subsp. carminata TaxID=160689 RepID=A0ABT1JV54_9ACTN|nr:twin-arginine translocase TatA/TatE family subunit [Nonomuraea roseoviolacea]MCP2345630.1 sec-independent protein translocase protein TatA [Nonomuraea roseoviolacea subsp. carminata]